MRCDVVRDLQRRFGRYTSISKCGTETSFERSPWCIGLFKHVPGAKVRPLSSPPHESNVILADLYLKPFSQPLRSIYIPAELRFYYSLLLEKGLRVRVEMADQVEEVLRMEEEPEEVVAMLDAEEIFAERRRLMPY